MELLEWVLWKVLCDDGDEAKQSIESRAFAQDVIPPEAMLQRPRIFTFSGFNFLVNPPPPPVSFVRVMLR